MNRTSFPHRTSVLSVMFLLIIMAGPLFATVELGDLVFLDLDGDGLFEPGYGEYTLPDVTVNACWDSDNDGIIDSYATEETDHFTGRYLGVLSGKKRGGKCWTPVFVSLDLEDPELPSGITLTTPLLGAPPPPYAEGDTLGPDDYIPEDGTYCIIYTSWDDKFYCADFGVVVDECEECEGGVVQLTLRYLGEETSLVQVYQKKEGCIFDGMVDPNNLFSFEGAKGDGTMGGEITIFVNEEEHAKIHTSCSREIGPGLRRGDFRVFEGYSLDGGLLCPVPGCGECDGKVTQLTLQYNGSNTAGIVVIQKKPEEVIYEGDVEPGGSFTFVGVDKKGTMGTRINIYVDDEHNTEIHTSCSQEIGPGLVSGDFEVLEGYSRNGGLLCPLEPEITKHLSDGLSAGCREDRF